MMRGGGELSEPEHPPLRQLFKHWRRLSAGRAFPLRQEIDPLDLRFALGHLLLAEVVEGAPPRFRYRLWGVALTEDYGRDMTGHFVDEIEPAALARDAQAAYEGVAASGLPALRRFDNIFEGRWFVHERLLLPLGLAAAPERVGMILGAIYRRPLPDGEAPPNPA